MDATDRDILRHLQADGRLPNAALAQRVHLMVLPRFVVGKASGPSSSTA